MAGGSVDSYMSSKDLSMVDDLKSNTMPNARGGLLRTSST